MAVHRENHRLRTALAETGAERPLVEAIRGIDTLAAAPAPPPGIEAARAALRARDERQARDLFLAYGERTAAKGAAAEAFRHAGALARLASTEQAKSAYARAVHLDPENFEGWLDYGRVLRQAGDLIAARRACQQAHDLLDPDEESWQLSAVLGFLGDLAMAEGQRSAALGHFERSLAIDQRHAAAWPEDVAAQRNLSISHNKIGDVKQAEGDRPGALAAYQAGLGIAARLAAQDPGNAEWQRDLIVSNVKLAEFAASSADTAAARRHYESASAIAHALADSGRLAPVDSWMLDDLEQRLAALGEN